ncbi:MAG: hypothetical protein GY854_02100 [Deltaproteobacteria bacterium]|nr:hypothetical protein [Deltaproteobacteria bacterium]
MGRVAYTSAVCAAFLLCATPALAQDGGVQDAGPGFIPSRIDGGLSDQSDDPDQSDDWGESDDWDESDDWGESDDERAPSVRIHGSFENQFTGMWLRLYNGGERFSVYDSTRIRVDLDADLPGGLKLRSDAVARLFVGETELYLVNLIPAKTFDDLLERDPRWAITAEDKYELENEYYIDNVYLKVPISKVLVVLGKQPLEQGAGYAWNPTDVFTEKDMFDPTYEKEGVIALRAVIPIGDTFSFDLAGVPDGSFEKWTGGGRAALRVGPLSLSAASYVTQVSKTDLEGSMDDIMLAALEGRDSEDAIHKTSAQRVMVGGDAVLDIKGVRLWAEGAYNFIEDKDGAPDDWWELVSGVEYYFPFETHVMAEYYHYGRGPNQHGGTYDFNDWMGLLSMDLKMLGRDFLFESIDHPVADFWTLGLSSFQSISDASAAIMADVRWEFVQDAELWLLVSAAAGEPDDFLSSARGQAWLRLKAYF